MLGVHLERWTKTTAESYHPPCFDTEESEEVSIIVVRMILY